MTGRVRGARTLSGSLLLLFLAAGALAGAPGSQERHCSKDRGAPPSKDIGTPPSKDAVFKSEIRPILVAHCAPCHEPGGKLYAKLPFDDPAVLSSHVAGVKKRLKGDDLRAFESWLAMAPLAREKGGQLDARAASREEGCLDEPAGAASRAAAKS